MMKFWNEEMNEIQQPEKSQVDDDAELAGFLACFGLSVAWKKSPNRWREAYRFGRVVAGRLETRPSTTDELMGRR
jgi:hypothetical protein